MKTKKLIFAALFTALIAAGAFIKIPVPVCPFTLQFLFTTLAGVILGPKLGALSVLVYVVLGLVGVPIFASGGGIGYIFQPTFGYLIGFILGTFVTGLISHRVQKPSMLRMFAANFSGLLVVYLCGMAYYYVIVNFYIKGEGIGLWALFLYCFLLAVPGDIVLCILASLVGKRLLPAVKKIGLS